MRRPEFCAGTSSGWSARINLSRKIIPSAPLSISRNILAASGTFYSDIRHGRLADLAIGKDCVTSGFVLLTSSTNCWIVSCNSATRFSFQSQSILGMVFQGGTHCRFTVFLCPFYLPKTSILLNVPSQCQLESTVLSGSGSKVGQLFLTYIPQLTADWLQTVLEDHLNQNTVSIRWL